VGSDSDSRRDPSPPNAVEPAGLPLAPLPQPQDVALREALWEAPSPSAAGISDDAQRLREELLLEDPLKLLKDEKKCEDVIKRLDRQLETAEDFIESQAIVGWLRPAARPLSLERAGTRVVQKALEVAQGEGKMALLGELVPHTKELTESPHGNYVVTKAVEVMPSSLIRGFVKEVERNQPDVMARHRFACRLLERFLEHCHERELKVVLDQVIAKAHELCRHPYGNFVVQTILEHGTSTRKQEVVEKLLEAELPVLAMHRTASHVVQKALEHSDQAFQERLIRTLLEAPTPRSLLEVACSRYGSFVVETIASIRPQPAQAIQVRNVLAASVAELGGSPQGRRGLAKFGLEAIEPQKHTDAAPAGIEQELEVSPDP